MDMGEQASTRFDPRHSYVIGIPRPGHTADSADCELQYAGRYKAKTLQGSQLTDNGVMCLEDLFRDNPLGLTEGQSYVVYELNSDTEQRRRMGGGTVLPKTQTVAELTGDETLADEETAEEANVKVPVYEVEKQEAARREESLHGAYRNSLDTLRGQLAMKDETIEGAHRLAAQAMEQNKEVLNEIRSTLATLTKIVQDRDQTAQELAKVQAEVDAIVKLREFEERVRKERDTERDQWRERERELERTSEERQGLGDVMDQMVPFVPLIQMVLERLLPPAGGVAGGMPSGGIPPGGIPPGMMQHGIPLPGGMPLGGMPPGGMPPSGTFGQRPTPGARPQQTSGAHAVPPSEVSSTPANANTTDTPAANNVKVF